MELDWEREEPRDNVIAGTVGAFLGSLIGVACIVLVNQLGYVSAICGAVMAVCSIKGYTMLGGVPVLISAFRDPSGRAAAREPEAVPAQEKAQTTLQAEFYSLQKNWMRPLRLDTLMHEAFGDAWPKQNPDTDAQQ